MASRKWMRFFSVSSAIALVALLALPAVGDDLSENRRIILEMLNITAEKIEKNYFDPNLKGLKWKELVAQARQKIEQAKHVNEMLVAVFMLVDALDDSHTKLIPPQRVAKILFGFDAQAFGNEIRIFEVTKDGAAKAAGLQLGDRILAINGVHITRQNFDQLMLVMRRLLPTVQLDLMIQRGSEAPRRIQYAAKVKPGPVVRDWREDETIWNLIREAQTNEIKAKYLKGDDGIGYVFLPDFVRLPIEMRELMGELSGSRAVIVDLRRNPGGNVDTVAEFIGYFQKEPLPIVDLKERKKSTTLRVKPQRLQFTGPLFVLVDSRSSSGSEVFARHMQLQKRGVVVGDGTPGRLTAARFHQEELAGGTIFFGLQIAGARVVFPNGEEVEKIGVKPDILCLPRENDLRTENDYCRAIAYAEARKVLNLESESSAKTETKPN